MKKSSQQFESCVQAGPVSIGKGQPLALIAGPCVIENRDTTLQIAIELAEICSRLSMPLIFKASFDKANRSSVDSFRGPGIEAGLEILAEVKNETGLPLVTDIHMPSQAAQAAETVDIIQIPAFLCRQTDLLIAAGKTGKPVNIKKGQFVAPHNMKQAVEKIHSTGNHTVMLTERGTAFGYNNLVVDLRGLALMNDIGVPVVFDATHSVQIPGGQGHTSGGERRFVPLLARAAVAAGVDAVFMEVHHSPENALCDGPNSWPLADFEKLVSELLAIERAVEPYRE
jgi:2-dehydro-3-deoxyphosphooctonate aldolase (KDO 8-P synthase)